MKIDETQECPGTGRKWMGGTGAAICPVCHRGPHALTEVKFKPGRNTPANVQKRIGNVPSHPRRIG